MRNETKTALALSLILAILVGMVVVLNIKNKNYKNKNYQECKQHTEDIEWCFKKFNPTIK